MQTKAIILFFLLFISCKNENKAEATGSYGQLEKLGKIDVKLEKPEEGEWRKEHPEKNQSFPLYVASKPVKVTEEKKVIYLQPIGLFSSAEEKMLRFTGEYVGYFFGLKTVWLEPLPKNTIPWKEKRTLFETEQFNAGYIINTLLPQKIPTDGIVIMALTATDLYPDEDWNYVFGLASYARRTGVTSMYRFEGYDFMCGYYALCLARLIKTATHEICHMFSMPHCTHAKCLMNGANYLAELDRQPVTLCSVCLSKLSWNLGFDGLTRMDKMISFCKKHKLDSDALILQQQYNLLKE